MERRLSGPVRAFLAVQALAWALFVYLDLCRDGAGTVPIKYGTIILCLLVSLCGSLRGGEWLVTAALLATLGADTFLLLLDCCYLLGIWLFCVVQVLYFRRICRANGGRTLWPVRLALFLGALAVLRGLGLLDLLNGTAMLYFTNFLCNTVQSAKVPGRRFFLFSRGLMLFLCCDLCVGIFNQPALFPGGLHQCAQVGMWLFYLPGQTMIALSGLPDSCFER